MKKVDLSVVVLNYNTKEIVLDCLKSIYEHTENVSFEVVVVDNGSTDGSQAAVGNLKSQISNLKLVQNIKNLGFAKGNNRARNVVTGEYILFLNSDTLLIENTFKKTVDYIKNKPEIGAITVKQILPSGKLDRDCRRSFPTPWVALTHFSGLDRFFPKSKLLGRYWRGYLSEDETQEVEVIQGSFFLSLKKVLDEVGWFDEDYFLNGEDIDLSWKIRRAGYRNVYYPKTSIIHLKGATKGKRGSMIKQPLKKRIKYALAGVDAMELFYKKRLFKNYPMYVTWLVIVGIRLMKLARVTREIIRL
ncbi:hypothetical protein A2415_05245 [candidate division WWE3 bacterium RIFOXYC1_FULL_39_7]|uniref:Glycosyltransferase 2-like domain-containing protein n=1 Tax=candidate division WWE3 bacterium RIFOXYC1_FULL_39_7 TaxID=1802643 RepID=A0A1F4WJM3_UNCKA|nr:MAG: hypothetical protein A2415_05245 [candidate division WWE3 bacterium RIFOXYC1_FULL_39_7]